MNKYILLIITAYFCTTCTNKYEGVKIDDALVPYYESFKVEAQKRGIIFDNSDEQIEGYIQNITSSGVIGLCRLNEENNENPSILLDTPYWSDATDLEREYVVYHELGHCFLRREHKDLADTTGTCISIMASGLGTCVGTYTSSNREELLDELFE
ncbi:MAG: putative metallopeptidase [Saprospiraceae bacterium]